MSDPGASPGQDEFELTLFGPGYGESIVLHVGDGVWIVVDSCIDRDKAPRAPSYLESIGADPAQAVNLIVATHWHDDHIRGMAQLVEACSGAAFCCATALCREEFLSVVATLERRHLTVTGSGARELYQVFACLRQSRSKPTFAVANRRIFARGACEVWSLSPSDAIFLDFLKTVGDLVPPEGQAKIRIPDRSPNDVAVALWIVIGNISVLLGSDLERGGWIEILQSVERPTGKASAFKIPHHGSENADVPEVWERMLSVDPFAVLTPWRRGGHALPSVQDVERILGNTANAFSTVPSASVATSPERRNNTVDRTIRESGIKLRQLAMSPGAVRLRRPIDASIPWQVKLFGAACHLNKFNQR